nr:unnamed protein product [Callosobruchus chinensis]
MRSYYDHRGILDNTKMHSWVQYTYAIHLPKFPLIFKTDKLLRSLMLNGTSLRQLLLMSNIDKFGNISLPLVACEL